MVRRVDREKTVSRKEVEEPKLGNGKDKRKWNGEVRSEVRWRLNCGPERVLQTWQQGLAVVAIGLGDTKTCGNIQMLSSPLVKLKQVLQPESTNLLRAHPAPALG
jgi:hypothetical protein